MALRAAPSIGFLHSFLPIAQASLRPSIRLPYLERCRTSLLPTIMIPIPSLVQDLWESVLRAVPKKKTSHMKKRHRFMAGKALKDVTALNVCSACGRAKRAHTLCPHCVASIKRWFGTDFKPRVKDGASEAGNHTPHSKSATKVETKPGESTPPPA